LIGIMLFCFSPLIPKISSVITYYSDEILIVFGISPAKLSRRINEAKNLPETALFCLSSNHFGYAFSVIPRTTHLYVIA